MQSTLRAASLTPAFALRVTSRTAQFIRSEQPLHRCCLPVRKPVHSQAFYSSAPLRSSRYLLRPLRAAGEAGGAVTEAPAAQAAAEVNVDSIDIRVGKILKAWKHPEADSLYVEEVDVGEAEGPRTICSGLVKFVPEEEMQDRLVLVLANLKPRNMRGVKSNGMLLCASDAAHENVELLIPPEGSVPGERVWFGSEEDKEKQEQPAAPNQLQKKKLWEAVQPLLKTTEDMEATFQGRPMRTSVGVVKSKSLKAANIS